MQVRVLRKAAVIAAAAGAFAAGRTASAQGGNPNITVDENGNGTIQFPGGPPNPLPGFPMPDPGPGGLPNALTYNLQGPPGLLVGDLILTEGPDISEVIRFNLGAAGATLVFYSDLPEPGEPPNLADIGFPGAFYPLQLMLPEVAIPGGEGIIYTPTPNQPGFVPGFNVTYTILSDIPAPGSAVLLGLGGLVASRRRRR